MGEKKIRSEQLINEGDMDKSVKLLKELEEIKEQRKVQEELYNLSRASDSEPMQIQQMTLLVCEVCGAFLSITDDVNRLVRALIH